jgi:aryl-alcohol dehydrogenase-like predicted oxidoreductase
LHKRKIGSLEVTVVGVGCNNFGWEFDAERTRRVMHASFDNGVNFFDTADYYGKILTTSELLIGEVIESIGSRRDELVIATKFGRRLDDRRKAAKAA